MSAKKEKQNIRTPWQQTNRPPMFTLLTKTVELLSEVNRMLLLDRALQAKNMAEHVTGVSLDEPSRRRTEHRVGTDIKRKEH
jgi:hypothetical protein